MGIPITREVANDSAKHPEVQDPSCTAAGTSGTDSPRTNVAHRRASVAGRPGQRPKPQVTDLVALLVDIDWQNVWRGQVGVVVDIHGEGQLEVEFRDRASGDSFQYLAIPVEHLLVLHQHQHPEN
mmetsp:Transcript_19578/g.54437  ORF Transcript_19578/g.54437 Transcript_19578/m.54437 type:complete len:125 (+) Transcript_19578:291-665(+)|eukprot:CAMPEP_0117649796 /NCGR_PEP_ID=MMETSP0804-20121206/1186_1 /TAXON_ID=1074897 /ORGANISM="Tetraselmis astigmatica, Strain CCMP880" /LENGTH=124 /DNA_ID=CAMNT_0005455603 /DNA_START=134 /DNA_END=508 /DNA_ORIENTATION=-